MSFPSPCYTGGFAALPRPYPGLTELIGVVVLLAGVAGLRAVARADDRSAGSVRRLAATASALGVGTFVVGTASRFGCRLGLRPAAALTLGAIVTSLVAVSVERRAR